MISAGPLKAQDTIQNLEAVTVSGQRTPSTLRTATPTQVATVERLKNEGALQLSDAVKAMAGVTMKDYGGIGGMKTVSARGLGSQFTTLTIDGVPVDDAQNGQVDLGRYLVGNAAYVSLSHGHQQSSLLTAKAYAAGSVINLESREPSFFMAEKTNLKLGMDLGSFGMMSPQLLWEQKWSKRLKMSLWANYLKSNGDYPFTLFYTTSRQDSSSTEYRKHSAMWMVTADGNLFYTINPQQRLTGKIHYMRSAHQLPGPVVFYSQRETERTEEEVAFAQLRWHRKGERWESQVIGKLQSTYDLYEDTSSSSLTLNTYRQHEAYLSGSALWHAHKRLDLSAAVDGDLSHLNSNLPRYNDVLRSKLLATVAARYCTKHLEVNANLLLTTMSDHVDDYPKAVAYSRLSPYAGLLWNLGHGATLRYFYKETFRVPNFSELYFFTDMTADEQLLRPECAHQHNIGITYIHALGERGSVSITADAYINHVIDKIIAIPRQNMFRWSMVNLDAVDITGADVSIEGSMGDVSLRLNYSFQRAVDKTDPSSTTYGHQIPYTPRHSGGGAVRWENRWVNLGTTAMVVGRRFSGRENTVDNLMPAYLDLGLSADRKFDTRLGTLRVQVQVLNLLDAQYEVVRSYPMMGRNYRLGILYEF